MLRKIFSYQYKREKKKGEQTIRPILFLILRLDTIKNIFKFVNLSDPIITILLILFEKINNVLNSLFGVYVLAFRMVLYLD